MRPCCDPDAASRSSTCDRPYSLGRTSAPCEAPAVSMRLTTCITDDDYEAWRAVRIAVVPFERCDTVAELRAQDSPDRLMLLAVRDGDVVGSGMADRADTAGRGFLAPPGPGRPRRPGGGGAPPPAPARPPRGCGPP